MVRPRPMIAVEVMPRVCPFKVLTGLNRTGSVDGCGRSAGRMEREKSKLAVRRTREEGKKRTEVTVET